MKIEKVHNEIRYLLTNENLNEGDLVYPIARGRRLPDGSLVLHSLEYNEYTSGFPDDPHTIKSLNNLNNQFEIVTDKGYGHKEMYFKIIKKEKQIDVSAKNSLFKRYEWVILDENGEIKTADRLVSVCDQGHYGSTVCSNCNENVENYFDVCPKCESFLKETKNV